MSRFPIVAFAMVALGACATTPRHMRADRVEVLEADRAFARASEARGLPAWEERFTSDAVIFPIGAPAVQGLSAIVEAWRKEGFDPVHLSWTPVDARVSDMGDLGYSWGTWEMTPPSGAAVSGKYITVWRRQADGSWKVEADLGSMDPPAQASRSIQAPGYAGD